MTPTTERLHYMDSLRAVAMFLGLVLHAAILFEMWAFDPLRIHDQPSPSLHYVAEMIHVFRMELFFLVAGFFSALVCIRRGAVSYARNRVQRILVPLLLCIAFLLPLTAGICWVDMEDSGQSIGTKFLECFLNPSYIVSFRQACVEWPSDLASVTGFIGTHTRLRHGWAEAAGVGSGFIAGCSTFRAVAAEANPGRAYS